MNNQKLLDYINAQKQSGKNEEEITSSLLQSGWDKDSISSALNSNSGKQTSASTDNSATLQGDSTVPKPKAIKAISILFWILSLTSLWSSIASIVVIYTMNNAMERGYPATLDFSFIKIMPLTFPLASILGIVSFLSFSYAAMRTSSGS